MTHIDDDLREVKKKQKNMTNPERQLIICTQYSPTDDDASVVFSNEEENCVEEKSLEARVN